MRLGKGLLVALAMIAAFVLGMWLFWGGAEAGFDSEENGPERLVRAA